MFPKVPDLTEGEDESFPAFSKKLTLKHENKGGRFVAAKKDIAPGDVLVSEAPYASVLLYETFGTHCQACFAM